MSRIDLIIEKQFEIIRFYYFNICKIYRFQRHKLSSRSGEAIPVPNLNNALKTSLPSACFSHPPRATSKYRPVLGISRGY